MRTFALLLLLPACTWVGQGDWDRANDRDGDGHLALVNGGDDCDDDDAAVHPGADELCNDQDDDCDGLDDEDPVDAPTWYPDADEDEYGDGTQGEAACNAPEGWIADDSDCDDGDAAVHPGADELCNDRDDDCDDEVDEDPVDETTWYLDSDGDDYGGEETIAACDQPSGATTTSDDCDDTDASIHPGAAEWCDGIDTDCDQTEDPSNLVSFVDTSGTWTDLSASFQDHSIASVHELSTDGTLYFCPGSYVGLISVSATSAAIVGRDGSASTTLSGKSDGPVISTTAGAATLGVSGLTLAEGDGDLGGGISSTIEGMDLTGRDLVITDCEADLGGGIYLENATFDLEEVTLTDNTAAQGGGGLYAEGGSGTAGGLWATGNATPGDGGGLTLSSGVLELADSLVDGNASGGAGGGIAASGRTSELALDATLVQDNNADRGGGLSIDDAAVTCTGTTKAAAGFHANVATSYGGGLTIDGSQASFIATSCDFGAGEDNNDPDDLYAEQSGQAYWYADDVDVECDWRSCE